MAGIRKQLEEYPEVSFIEDTAFVDLMAQLIEDYQNQYRVLTGKDTILAQADPIRLILYSCAVAIYQGYQYADRAGKMGLLKYSTGEFLDGLAALKKVKRNPATHATTILKFTLSTVLNSTAGIPKGTRIKAGENLYFETLKYAEIPAGKTEIESVAVCQISGKIGNGFLPGELKTLVDPLSYHLSVINITETGGGADLESDDDLAERIYLAPSSYSTAGPAEAYQYWAKTYSQLITDCKIKNESPGEVDIYPILINGEIPGEDFINGLEEYLQNSSIRPLTDRVVVKKPRIITYDIKGTYYIAQNSQNAALEIQKKVEQAVNNYVIWQKEQIGRDINPSQLIYLMVGAGAKNVELEGPVFTIIDNDSIAFAGEISMIYGGLKDD